MAKKPKNGPESLSPFDPENPDLIRPSLRAPHLEMQNLGYLGHFAQNRYIEQGHNDVRHSPEDTMDEDLNHPENFLPGMPEFNEVGAIRSMPEGSDKEKAKADWKSAHRQDYQDVEDEDQTLGADRQAELRKGNAVRVSDPERLSSPEKSASQGGAHKNPYSIDDTGERTKSGRRVLKLNRRD